MAVRGAGLANSSGRSAGDPLTNYDWVREIGVLTAAMPERLRLMVTLASWCALRFGETVERRRGDIDLSDEVIRIRRAAVRVKQDGDDLAAGTRYSYQTRRP